ncbi:hypothetical protein M422DRAFT_45349 [Sphaerobolus stellatus SS14]|nr:hypothetical protein M422DRAFT_45349 [Sphaerobolus stellatus SS14]
MHGHKVSEDVAWIVIRMLPTLSLTRISAYTGLSEQKIRDIKYLYQQTGAMVRKGGRKDWEGIITSEQMKLLRFCISHSPDYYLDELRAVLHSGGAEVSLPTIWQALHRAELSMKLSHLDADVHQITKTAME